jgi:hypothetical protein
MERAGPGPLDTRKDFAYASHTVIPRATCQQSTSCEAPSLVQRMRAPNEILRLPGSKADVRLMRSRCAWQ